MRAIEKDSGRPEGMANPHDGTRRVVYVGYRGPCSCDGGEVLAFTGTRILFVRCRECNGTGRRDDWRADLSGVLR